MREKVGSAGNNSKKNKGIKEITNLLKNIQ